MSFSSILLRRSLRCSNHLRSLFYSSHLRPSVNSSSSPSPLFSSSSSAFLRSFSSSSAKVKDKASLSSDDKLTRVIDSEIECATQSDLLNQVVELPENFPFEVVDNPGDEAVILLRDFDNEKVKITVFMNLEDTEDLDEDGEDDSQDDSESFMDLSLSLVVAVDKGKGRFLEFGCSLNANELQIRTMVLKKHDDPDEQNTYQGPEFSDLDENLQKSLHSYLHVRGVDGSLFDFLHQYMQNKDEREYLTWLKNMKGFVGN